MPKGYWLQESLERPWSRKKEIKMKQLMDPSVLPGKDFFTTR